MQEATGPHRHGNRILQDSRFILHGRVVWRCLYRARAALPSVVPQFNAESAADYNAVPRIAIQAAIAESCRSLGLSLATSKFERESVGNLLQTTLRIVSDGAPQRRFQTAGKATQPRRCRQSPWDEPRNHYRSTEIDRSWLCGGGSHFPVFSRQRRVSGVKAAAIDLKRCPELIPSDTTFERPFKPRKARSGAVRKRV